ncbi:MAG: hypothetical protein QOH48_1916 [Actinomycetota bacterium]|nr:hypothetical protein [Actinomycetota bacterium]
MKNLAGGSDKYRHRRSGGILDPIRRHPRSEKKPSAIRSEGVCDEGDLRFLIPNDHRHNVEAKVAETRPPIGQPARSQPSQPLLLAKPDRFRRLTPAGGVPRLHFAKHEQRVPLRHDVDLALAAAEVLFENREAQPPVVVRS